MRESPRELHVRWTFEGEAGLAATEFEMPAELTRYRRTTLASGTDTDPRRTLLRQRDYFLAQADPALKAEAKNMEVALIPGNETIRLGN